MCVCETASAGGRLSFTRFVGVSPQAAVTGSGQAGSQDPLLEVCGSFLVLFTFPLLTAVVCFERSLIKTAIFQNKQNPPRTFTNL